MRVTGAAAPDKSDSALILRGVSWTFSAELLNQAARIGFTVILARFLTPAEYGVAGMALVVSGFVVVFSDLGLGTAMVQRLSLSERDISTAFWTGVASGVIFTVIGIGAAGVVSHFFNESEVRELFAVMSLTFLITSLGATQAALLTRSMNFRTIALRNFAGTIIGGAVGVYVAVTGGGAWAIIAQQIASASVSTLLLWLAVPWRPRFLIDIQSLREMGGFGLTVLSNRVINIVQQTTTPLLIGRLLGAQSLGLYTLANNVALMPITRITLPLGQVLFPALSRHQGDPKKVGDMWLKALSTSAAITLPTLAALAVVAPYLVTLLLDDNWKELGPVIQILVIVGAMRAMQGPMTAVVLALGRADMLVWISIVVLATTIPAILLGVPWGILGVATMLAIAAVGIQTLWSYRVGKQVQVTLTDYRRAVWGVVEATAIMAVIMAGTRTVLAATDLGAAVILGACIVVGIVVYIPMLHWRAPTAFDMIRDVVLRTMGRRAR